MIEVLQYIRGRSVQLCILFDEFFGEFSLHNVLCYIINTIKSILYDKNLQLDFWLIIIITVIYVSEIMT